MISWLFVSFSDGKTYKIPSFIIASHRAKYYANTKAEDDKEGWQKIIDDAIAFALNDAYELECWFTDNMDWFDVKEHAILISERQIDYSAEKEWVNAEKWTE